MDTRLRARQLCLQPVDPQGYGTAAKKGVLHPCTAQRAGHIPLIQHTFGCDSRLMAAELLHARTAHHPSQQIVHIAARQVVFRFHLLRQAILQGLARFLFPQLADVHNAKGALAKLPLDLIVEFLRLRVAGRLHQEIKLLGVEIALHRAAPGLLLHFQHVGQNQNRHRLPCFLLQLRAQPLLKLEQPSGVVLDVFPQIGQGGLLLICFGLVCVQTDFHPVGGSSNGGGELRYGSLRLLKEGERTGKQLRSCMIQGGIYRLRRRRCLLHLEKIFFCFPGCEISAYTLDAADLLPDFQRQRLHARLKLFPFLQQRVLFLLELFLLQKDIALPNRQLQFLPPFLFCLDLLGICLDLCL